MISYIKGKVVESGPGYVVLETGGIGYHIEVPATVPISEQRQGYDMRLFVCLMIRDESIVLYGFPSREEEKLFRELISVSGVGPKAAMNILSAMDVESFKVAISREDTSALTRISGIGAKTAKRLILELKERLSRIGAKAGGSGETGEGQATRLEIENEAIQALVSLGYQYSEARGAVISAISENNLPADTGELVKLALRALSRH
ncbi:MAG TPA: Holliday junction branch migration protein RuvA [Firmicutes bacterium]|nr:Holliday junction branch migration protein RuvA [Bacillota bacterium]